MKKKITTSILFLIMAIVFPLCLMSCNKTKVESFYIKEGTYEKEVEHNSSISTTEFLKDAELYAKLSNKTEIRLNLDDVEITKELKTTTPGITEIVLSYSGIEIKIEIEVVKTISDIKNPVGLKETYKHKRDVDSGITSIDVIYSDGSSAKLESSAFIIEDFSTAEVGERTLKIVVGDFSKTFKYEVVRVVESIEIKDGFKERLEFGESFLKDNMVLKATYSNGETATITSGFEITADYSTVGTKELKITYEENEDKVTCTKEFEIYRVLTGITSELDSIYKIKYGTKLNVQDLKIKASYNNETTSENYLTELEVSGFNKEELNSVQTVTLSYIEEGVSKKCNVSISVYEEVEEIYCDTTNNCNWFELNKNISFDNLVIKANYTKNKAVILEKSKLSFTPEASTIKNNVENKNGIDIKCTYNYTENEVSKSKQVTFKIYVANPSDFPNVEISNAKVVNATAENPLKVNHKEAMDYSKIEIELTFNNGLKEIVKYNSDNFEFVDDKTVDVSTCGLQTIKLNYTKGSLNFSNIEVHVEVVKVLDSIRIKEKSGTDKVLYNEEPKVPTLEAVYSNGDTEEIPYSKVVVVKDDYKSKFTTNLTAESFITYKFGGKEVSMNFTVYNLPKELIVEHGEEFKTTIDYGTLEEFDYSGLTFKIKYYNNQIAQIDASKQLTHNPIYAKLVGGQDLIYKYSFTNDLKEEKDKTDFISCSIRITVNDVYKGIVAENYDEVIKVGETYNTSKIKVYDIYESGRKDLLANNEYTINPFTTDKAGTKELIINKNNSDKSITLSVEVIKGYKITSFTVPKSIEVWESESKKENGYKTSSANKSTIGFSQINLPYIVGCDNPFKFEPVMLALSASTNKLITVKDYSIKADVFIIDESAKETKLLDLTNYVSIDAKNRSFQFTKSAIGKTFKISVLPENMTSEDNATAQELVFKVVEGYNVYDASGLSTIDNANIDKKWNNYKTSHNIALNFHPSKIILHNNILIGKEDIPEGHFYKAGDVVQGIRLTSNDIDYNRALGSLKDTTEDNYGYIYQRNLKDGENFEVEGNYFKISTENMPLCVREQGKVNSAPDQAITTHTSLFLINGENVIDEHGNVIESAKLTNTTFKNLSLIGNTQKSEIPSLSGGLLGVKANGTNFTAENCLAQKWFIPFLMEGSSAIANKVTQNFINTNIFDAYATLLYLWGARDVHITNSNLIGAGGPVMICDHVHNNKETGEGGYPVGVHVDDKSVTESWVTGTEGWFNTYGASELVSQLKAVDKVILNTFAGLKKSETYKSILDATNQKLNLIALYKAGDVEGLSTSKIKGSFNASGFATPILDFDFNAYRIEGVPEEQQAIIMALQTVATQGMLFQFDGKANCYPDIAQGGSNTLVSPIVKNLPDQVKQLLKEMGFSYTQENFIEELLAVRKYASLYLFNGMGAVIGAKDFPILERIQQIQPKQ